MVDIDKYLEYGMKSFVLIFMIILTSPFLILGFVVSKLPIPISNFFEEWE